MLTLLCDVTQQTNGDVLGIFACFLLKRCLSDGCLVNKKKHKFGKNAQ